MATYEAVGQPRYVLKLTKEEARTLLFVCNQVGGEPEGRRGHMDSIGNALTAAGVEVPSIYDEQEDFALLPDDSSIYFKDAV